jgi:flagellar hook-associated protein 3 FlgL
MRITNGMISSQMATNLNAPMEKLMELQNQASTGKRIAKASDDPLGTSTALHLRSSLDGMDQYQKNLTDAKTRLATVDTSLGNITRALQQVKQMALMGANGLADETGREVYAAQVHQQMDIIVHEANTSYLGKPLFGGNQTSSQPVTTDPSNASIYTYNGDDGVKKIAINDTTDLTVSITAKEILNFDHAAEPSQPDVLSLLGDLAEDLKTGNQTGIQDKLKQLDGVTQNVVVQRGKMGTVAQQVDFYAERMTLSQATVNQQLSDVEDVDITQTLTQLQAEQNVYQSSLLAASQMAHNPTLADYLK